MAISLEKEIKSRFKYSIVCPHCGSSKTVKYGFFNGEQRYRCKECKKTFNAFTGTILSWSHYKDKWGSYMDIISKDMSLRKAQTEVGVNYGTLFRWRHKILDRLYRL